MAERTTDGDAFLKYLQNLSHEVQQLEEVIGNIDDWLHFIDLQGSEIEASRRPPVISNENTSSENTTHSMNTTQKCSSEDSEDESEYDILKYMPKDSTECRKVLTCIFVIPFQKFLNVTLKTFKDIENEMCFLLESAPMRYRQIVVHQMDDPEMKIRIEAR